MNIPVSFFKLIKISPMALTSIFKLQIHNTTAFLSTHSTSLSNYNINKVKFTSIFRNIMYFYVAAFSSFNLKIQYRIVNCYFV